MAFPGHLLDLLTKLRLELVFLQEPVLQYLVVIDQMVNLAVTLSNRFLNLPHCLLFLKIDPFTELLLYFQMLLLHFLEVVLMGVL